MYICDICEKPSRHGEPQVHFVTERRERRYVNKESKESYGWEIVRENKVCTSCADEIRKRSV